MKDIPGRERVDDLDARRRHAPQLPGFDPGIAVEPATGADMPGMAGGDQPQRRFEIAHAGVDEQPGVGEDRMRRERHEPGEDVRGGDVGIEHPRHAGRPGRHERRRGPLGPARVDMNEISARDPLEREPVGRGIEAGVVVGDDEPVSSGIDDADGDRR